jgi:TRAP-type C4-dicarboxylate transport system substrate-binding protein
VKKKILLNIFIFLLTAGSILAAPVQIKFASLAPENTAWGKALNKMAKEWSDASGGEVKLTIYHNGMLGSDESEILKKLRTNSIQAAVFTSVGLNNISKKLFTLSCPFFINDDAEMDYVLANLGGDLEDTVEKSGYKLIAWSKIGWIRFFARQPVSAPADLKKQKLAGPDDTPELSNLFKSLGYTVIPISYNDVLMALTSNKIDSVAQIPAFVASMQIFGIAKNMLSLDIAPVMGGIIMNQVTWRRIPDKYKPRLLEIAKKIALENDKGAQSINNEAISVMARNGLSSTSPTPAQQKLWRDEIGGTMSSLVDNKNSVLDPEIYRRIEALLKTYRSGR